MSKYQVNREVYEHLVIDAPDANEAIRIALATDDAFWNPIESEYFVFTENGERDDNWEYPDD